jgi:hypothetical protein
VARGAPHPKERGGELKRKRFDTQQRDRYRVHYQDRNGNVLSTDRVSYDGTAERVEELKTLGMRVIGIVRQKENDD